MFAALKNNFTGLFQSQKKAKEKPSQEGRPLQLDFKLNRTGQEVSLIVPADPISDTLEFNEIRF
jgi:hypothetical protein